MAEFFSGNNFIIDFLNIIIFVFGGIFTYKGMITVTDFATFIIFVNIFLTPIKNLINFIEQLQNGMSGFTRLSRSHTATKAGMCSPASASI